MFICSGKGDLILPREKWRVSVECQEAGIDVAIL
jgi:hypothetical protein